MATIDLDIGGSSGTTTVDQSAYSGDTVLNLKVLSSGADLTITNTTDSSDVLDITQTVSAGVLSNTTLNLDGANVSTGSGLVGIQAGSTFNYNLSNGASLDLNSPLVGLSVATTTNIDMGADSANTLTFDPPLLGVIPTYNLSGVSNGDQINVDGATGVKYEGGQLIFTKPGPFGIGTVDVVSFNAPGLNTDDIIFENGGVHYACYLKGTNIAVPGGEVAVEALKAGDKVLTASGGVATVKWLGHRTLYKNRIPEKDARRAFPILFKKDSIAENVPHRDLTLSPGHHISFDGALVPAMALVNGQSIVQLFDTKVFQYFHVELEQFDIMLAEGVPAESYVDTGNRNMFQNAREVAMNPDFGPAQGRPNVPGITVERKGPVVDAIRARLNERAEALQAAEVKTRAA